MNDLTVVTPAGLPATPSIVHAKVTKAGNAVIPFDYSADRLPQTSYEAILQAGVVFCLNTRMSKITKKDIPNDADRVAAALRVAQENADALYAGTFKLGRAVKAVATASREETTEAMRIARLAVKDEIRRQGGKLSHYSAADITAAAKTIVESNPTIMAQAKANLASAVKVPVPVVHEDPKKVREAELKAAKARAEKASQLSAKQAGLTKVVAEVIKH